MSATRVSRAPSKDPVLSGAVELARTAAEEMAVGGHVGEHQGFELVEPRVGTHYFDSEVPGYRGWRWSVTVARVPRGRTPSVNEVELVPGEGALLSPDWVPWADRLQPGDVSPTDVLPYVAEDARLVQSWEFTGEEDDADRLQVEDLGLARRRVLSVRGREEALQRWYDGPGGPATPGARSAAEKCASCGFLLRLAGTPRGLFGVCANEWSADDGRVVSVDHGCGAHSETSAPEPAPMWDATPPVLDEMDLLVVPALNPLPSEDDGAPDEVEDTTTQDETDEVEDTTEQGATDEVEDSTADEEPAAR